MKNYILTALILSTSVGTGCGREDDKKSDAQTVEASDKKTTPHALALQTKKDLPECTEANEAQLVYLTEDKEFYTCDAGEWASINIKMDTNQAVYPGMFWTDSKTSKTWYVVGLDYYGRNCNAQPGAQDFIDDPDADQVRTALKNGLFGGMNVAVWLNGASVLVYSKFPSVDVTALSSSRAFHLCLVKE